MKGLVLALLVVSGSVFAEPSPDPKRQRQLTNMFKHDCGSCHGISGKGGLGSPLLAESVKHKSDAFLVNTILNGRKGTAMPPWKPFLSRQEALWMVSKLIRQQN